MKIEEIVYRKSLIFVVVSSKAAVTPSNEPIRTGPARLTGGPSVCQI